MDKSESGSESKTGTLRRRIVKLATSAGIFILTSPSATAYSHDDDVDVDYTPDIGSVSFISPEKGANKRNPVNFEMTATDFTIEPAIRGVSDGAGHFHILVDQSPLSPGEVIPNDEKRGYYHYGGGQNKAEIEIEPGEHTIRLQAGDAKHRAYNLTDSLNISVKESASSKESTFILNNVGLSAWEVRFADGTDIEVSGGDNPTITLETGTRYIISNEGWSSHPLAFEGTDGTTLLSQDGAGTYETDESVEWVDEGNLVEFTLTKSLASDLTTYLCTVHGSMEGSIEISDGSVTPPADRVSPYTNEDGYVDSEGLLDAGVDYRNGEIDDETLSEVASAFRSGEPLS